MTLSRANRRQLILSWFGIGFAWAASVGLGVVLLAEWLALLVPAATLGAVGGGLVVGKRLRAHQRRASITVGDLRATRMKRR